MRSPRALVVIGALMGCEASGLRIDVILPEDGPAPDHIRLFVGVPDEVFKATIGPEDFGVTREGSRWVRDPMDYDDIIEVKPGAELSFGFLSDVDHAELGAIIAVGYTGPDPTSAGSLFHVKTGVGVVRVFKLQLFPAADARDPRNRNKPVQIEIWGPTPGEEACVHLKNTHPDRDMSGPHPHDSAFIVSRDNRDCDRWSDDDALECSADIHEMSSPPIPEDFDCATFDTSTPGINHCVLGGPRCVDGAMPDGECMPSTFCAPPSVCDACSQLPDADERRDCIRAPYGRTPSMSTMAGVKCHVGTARLDATPNTPPMVCPLKAEVMLPIPQAVPPLVCSNAMVARIGEELGSHLQIDDTRFEVSVTAECALTLAPTGEASPSFAADPTLNGLVTVELDNGRSLALPLQIIVDPPDVNCDGGNYCQLVGTISDQPFACLDVPRQMPPP